MMAGKHETDSRASSRSKIIHIPQAWFFPDAIVASFCRPIADAYGIVVVIFPN